MADHNGMYLRRCYKQKNGKRHAYWALVESYRTPNGPRQRLVTWIGETDEEGRLAVKHAAETGHNGMHSGYSRRIGRSG